MNSYKMSKRSRYFGLGKKVLEKLTYLGLPNCYKLSNDVIELIVTTAIGPRVLRYGFFGEENILGEIPRAVITQSF